MKSPTVQIDTKMSQREPIWFALPVCCVMMNVDDRVVGLNPAAEKLFHGIDLNCKFTVIRLLGRGQISLLRAASFAARQGHSQQIRGVRLLIGREPLAFDVHFHRIESHEALILVTLLDRGDETRVRRDNAVLRDLLDATTDLIHATDPQGNFRIVNKSYAQMHGIRANAVVGLNRSDVTDLNYADDAAITDQIVLRTRKEISKTDHLKSGHTLLSFDTRKFPIFGTSGELLAIGAVSRQNTLERSYKDHLRFTEAIFQNAQDAIAVTDISNSFQRVNNAFELLAGVSNAALTGRSLNDVFSDQHASTVFEQARNAVKSVGYWSGELEISTGTTGVSQVWARVNALRDDEDQIMALLWILTDLSELRSAQSIRLAAERANEAKSQFLAKMSHELRTPLSGILGALDLVIGAGTGLEADQRAMLQAAYASSETLLSIVNDLLDMSRLEAGKVDLDLSPFSLAEVVRRVTAIHSVIAKKKGITFDVDFPAESRGHYIGDATRITQILHNLIGNAIKFTPSGGRVMLRVSGKSPLSFAISDTGIGATREELDRIFSPFEQADNTISRRFGGTGLGLSIVKNMVDLMHGTIDVTSEKGVGSTFAVSLPLEVTETDAETLTTEQTETTKVHQSLAGLKILVADDSDINRDVLIAYLSNAGATVIGAADGLEALQIAQTQGFDLLCLDISMPGLAGNEVLTRVHQHCSIFGVAPPPSIAVTANAMPKQKQAYLDLGFEACLTKPFRASETVDLVLAVLAKRGRRSEHGASLP